MAPFLFAWPWAYLGNFKYVLYVPIVVAAWASRLESPVSENFYLHILLITGARLLMYHAWLFMSRFLPLFGPLQMRPDGLSFRQVDRERHCDNHYLLQATLLFIGHKWLGLFQHLPMWSARGLITMAILHMGPTELLYYCIHRAFHTKVLFEKYHKLHHESVSPEPATVGSSTFLEQLVLVMVMAVPILGAHQSIVNLYLYLLTFDSLRALGHSTIEIVPTSVLRVFPLLRYLLYTPSYHTLHHKSQNSNFCLFMPLYDYLGKTMNPDTRRFHTQLREERHKKRVPDYVFLAHLMDMSYSLHSLFLFPSFASQPYTWNPWMILYWLPLSIIAVALLMWGSVFQLYSYYLRDRFQQIWMVPCYGFMYFFPSQHGHINKVIEDAILDADRMGVKVISLAALNKNEALNGGGKLFVEKHPNLKVRVCHGNTLTAAIIVKEIPTHVREVFLSGATSKLGRAISLYLSRKGIRVLMLTFSQKRFEAIVADAVPEARSNLVQVTKYQAARNCQTWILGKWAGWSAQMLAPPGTHFHQFVVPPVIPFRRDCTYGKLAAMRLPDDARGIACCEYTLDRYVVHACHAGGLVHSLEGWTHHEVGAIHVDQIDVVWEAALKHGLALA